jgi:chaperonin GroEL
LRRPEGTKAVAAAMNPMDIKRGIDIAVSAIIAHIRKHSRRVSTNEEIAQIGTISANGDREIGQMLARAMQKVGHEGVITVEEASSRETELEVVEVMQFDRGYISPYFVNNAEKMVAELEDPYIFIFEKQLSNLPALLPLSKLNGARADAKRAGGLLAGCTPNASLASVSVIGSEMAHTQNSLLFNPASK